MCQSSEQAVNGCRDDAAALADRLILLQSTSLTAATALLEPSPDAEGIEAARQLLLQSRSAMQDAARLPQGRELVLQDKMLAYLPLQVLHSRTLLHHRLLHMACMVC